MGSDFQACLTAWLQELGHQKWSDKTVTARFGDYEAFVQQHVIKKKIRGTSSFISRLPQEMRFYPDRAAAQAHLDNVPVSYAAWCGVRFTDDLNPFAYPEKAADQANGAGIDEWWAARQDRSDQGR
jgi:hypothetical protein